MSFRSNTNAGLFGFKNNPNRRRLHDEDDPNSLFLPSERSIDRRRHTSSLISDHSDGLPYVSRENSINGISDTESLVTTPAPKSKTMSDTAAPMASMRPTFDISGPPATATPAPSVGRTKKRKTNTSPLDDESEDVVEDGHDATPAGVEGAGDGNGSDSFYKAYRQLLSGHQKQTDHFERLHNEHAKALKKIQNLSSRRKQRIEQLEREIAALRRSVSAGTAHQSTKLANTEELSAASRTIEMLTKDLTSWENKYTTSQQALRAISDDAATFERKYNGAQSTASALAGQVEDLKRQIEEGKIGLSSGTKQLKGLQRILRKVDRTIVERVRELARLSAEWDRRGGADEQLRTRVSDEMGELVAAWRRFEGEYDEGVAGEDGGNAV